MDFCLAVLGWRADGDQTILTEKIDNRLMPAVNRKLDKSLKSEIHYRLNSLEAAVNSRKPRGIERQRIAADMEVYAARILSGEYKKSRFVKNTLNIRDRNRELLDDLCFFSEMGQGWSDIFSELKLSKSSTVLDMGCGCFPKVELGLHYSNFRGRAFLLDSDPWNLKGVESFLDFIQVQFDYRLLRRNLWRYKGKRFDLITSNHLLDDLILDEYCNSDKNSVLKLYENEKCFASAWKQISRSSGLVPTLAQRFCRLMDRLIKPGGFVCLVDYISHSHRSMHLSEPWTMVQKLRQAIRGELTRQAYTQICLRNFKGIHGRCTKVPATAALILQRPSS